MQERFEPKTWDFWLYLSDQEMEILEDGFVPKNVFDEKSKILFCISRDLSDKYAEYVTVDLYGTENLHTIGIFLSNSAFEELKRTKHIGSRYNAMPGSKFTIFWGEKGVIDQVPF